MSEAALSELATPRPAGDKREAILSAALRIISRLGLHNAPMSAVAKEAGVAAGTLYLYFPSKDAMINALYLDVLQDRDRALIAESGLRDVPPDSPREGLRVTWHALARWYLEHPEASNLIVQCRASGILTEDTRAIEQRMEDEGRSKFEAAVASGHLRDLSRHEFWALYAGPIAMLVQMRDTGEVEEISAAMLETTFQGVCRAVLP